MWDCTTPTFRSDGTLVMIWGAFTSFDKCPLVIMPLDKRTASDFVTIVYEATLRGYHPQQSELMEDGDPVHYSSLTKQWRQAHGLAN